jgi:hypothetical protein
MCAEYHENVASEGNFSVKSTRTNTSGLKQVQKNRSKFEILRLVSQQIIYLKGYYSQPENPPFNTCSRILPYLQILFLHINILHTWLFKHFP